MNHNFVEFCRTGQLNEAKELYLTDHNIDIHHDEDVAFRYSYLNNHLNIAQWLYSLGGINIHAINDMAFRVSCAHSYLDMAKWLYSLGDVNIHARDNDAFRLSCDYVCLNVVKWLLLITKFNDKLVDYYLPPSLHEYAFNLGYLPVINMKTSYVLYKNKIRDEININLINDLINIIVTYV